MSHKVFEYFFEPQELGPAFSELPGAHRKANSRVQRGAIEQAQPAKLSVPILEQPENLVQPSSLSNRANPGSNASTVEAETGTESNVKPTQNIERSQRSRVRRLLSVHALGQYVYCVRSAILAAERGDERDMEEPLLRLTYLPNFDRQRIEEMMSAKLVQIGFFLLYGLGLGILIRIGIVDQKRIVFYPSGCALIVLAVWTVNVLICVFELAIRRRAAMQAEAREPEPNVTKIQPVNWWSMLKAGFDPISYQRPFQHPELPLEGSPWRVLQRESLRIPVIKCGSHKIGSRRGELFPKHQVRLVAYALLLEATSHVRVPYGLVFPADSARGLAFPISDELRHRAQELLHNFHQSFLDSQELNLQPDLPPHRTRCANCENGKPVPTTVQDVHRAQKLGQQLVVLQHHSGDIYRCECGDRFGSAPPHRLTSKKDLRAAVI